MRNIFKKKSIQEESSTNIINDELLNVTDKYGKKIEIYKSQYKDSILIPKLEHFMNSYLDFYYAINEAIEFGFINDIALYVNKFASTYIDEEIGSSLLSFYYIKINDLTKAYEVINAYLLDKGKSSKILHSLAILYKLEGNEQYKEVNKESLQLDPNFKPALEMYVFEECKSGKNNCYINAIKAISKYKNSWLSTLYLAQIDIQKNKINNALKKYDSITDIWNQDEALLFISDNLTYYNYYTECVDFVGKYYDVHNHNVDIGINLLTSYHHIGLIKEGKILYDELRRNEHLSVIEKLKLFEQTFSDNTISAMGKEVVIEFEKPVWLDSFKHDFITPNCQRNIKVGIIPYYIPTFDKYLDKNHSSITKELSFALPLLYNEYFTFFSNVSSSVIIKYVKGVGLREYHKELVEYDMNNLCIEYNVDYIITGNIIKDDFKYNITTHIYSLGTDRMTTNKTTLLSNASDANTNKLLNEVAIVFQFDPFKEVKIFKTISNKNVVNHLLGLYNILLQTLVVKDPSSLSMIKNEDEIINSYIDNYKNFESDTNMIIIISGLDKIKKSGSSVYKRYETQVLNIMENCENEELSKVIKPFCYKLFNKKALFNKFKKNLTLENEDIRYIKWLENLD